MTYEAFLRLQPGDRIECRRVPSIQEGDLWEPFYVLEKQVALPGDVISRVGEGEKDYVCRAWVVRMPWHDESLSLWFRRINCRLPVEGQP